MKKQFLRGSDNYYNQTLSLPLHVKLTKSDIKYVVKNLVKILGIEKMNIVAIVQARLSSKRLPKKVITKIANKPLIEILLARLKNQKKLTK